MDFASLLLLVISLDDQSIDRAILQFDPVILLGDHATDLNMCGIFKSFFRS